MQSPSWLSQDGYRSYKAWQWQSRTAETKSLPWPSVYRNRETGKVYRPHHGDEYTFVIDDNPRYALAKGGEGGGKSVAGIIKVLERIRRGCSGIMVSPDLPHFKKSLWREFRNWCPWECVVPSQQYRASREWQPSEAFELVFNTGAALMCGGIESPISWEGPNVNFAHFDEARKAPHADALKVLDGRIRILGPQGETPQLWLTTTPRMNWLHEYFGPLPDEGEDPREYFKRNTRVISLYTRDNAENLAPGYADLRRASLSEAEARVLLEAAWEDIADADHFLPSITLWDACQEILPAPSRNEPMIVAIDAATGRADSPSDCFGMVGVTRHPTRHTDAAIRLAMKWQARAGQKISFDGTPDSPGPIAMLKRWKDMYNIVQVAYDPTELRYVAQQLQDVFWFEEIPQGAGTVKRPGRGMFDKQYYDLIIQKRVSHDGNADLREHVKNSNRTIDAQDKKLRIVKRTESLKIDLNIASCMGVCEVLRLDL